MYYSLKMAPNSFLISQPSLYTPSKTNSFIKFSPPQNPLKLKNINSSFLGLFNTKKMTHFDQKVNAFDEKNSAIVKNIASCYLGLSITKKRTHFDQIVNAFDEESSTIIVEEGVEVEEEKGGFKFGNEEEGVEVEAIGDGGEEEVGGEYEQVSEDAKLFVGNLPFDVDSEKLAHLFEQAGIVEIAEVIYNRATDQSRGFGFVTMSAVEEADKAVDMLNRYDLNGRLLTVNKAAPRGSRPERTPRVFEPSYRIYVGNLPWDVDDSRLEQIFSEHGKVVDARVVYDRESGRSRGFGFVRMSSESDQNDAIANLDGQSLDGRTIRVNVAEERPRRF